MILFMSKNGMNFINTVFRQQIEIKMELNLYCDSASISFISGNFVLILFRVETKFKLKNIKQCVDLGY